MYRNEIMENLVRNTFTTLRIFTDFSLYVLTKEKNGYTLKLTSDNEREFLDTACAVSHLDCLEYTPDELVARYTLRDTNDLETMLEGIEKNIAPIETIYVGMYDKEDSLICWE